MLAWPRAATASTAAAGGGPTRGDFRLAGRLFGMKGFLQVWCGCAGLAVAGLLQRDLAGMLVV